jgi:hypothetical protein
MANRKPPKRPILTFPQLRIAKRLNGNARA